jgi:hypothetical protein
MNSITNDRGEKVFASGQPLSTAWVKDVYPNAIEEVNAEYWNSKIHTGDDFSFDDALFYLSMGGHPREVCDAIIKASDIH